MTTEERVRRLEREVRWTRIVGALAVLALVCVVLVGAGQEQEKPKVLDEVRAKKFVLVDEAGQARGGLESSGDSSTLRVQSPNGKVFCFLSADDAMARISVGDGVGSGLRAGIIASEGSASLDFYEADDKDLRWPRIGMRLLRNESRMFFVGEKGGKMRALFGARTKSPLESGEDKMETRFVLRDRKGQVITEVPKR